MYIYEAGGPEVVRIISISNTRNYERKPRETILSSFPSNLPQTSSIQHYIHISQSHPHLPNSLASSSTTTPRTTARMSTRTLTSLQTLLALLLLLIATSSMMTGAEAMPINILGADLTTGIPVATLARSLQPTRINARI